MSNVIDILHKARKSIANSHDVFVCIAVKRTTGEYDRVVSTKTKKYKASREILDYIKIQLEGYYTLDDWICARSPALSAEYRNSTSKEMKEKMRVTRLAWIDDMIRHFERTIMCDSSGSMN